jgi:hypothetical protein
MQRKLKPLRGMEVGFTKWSEPNQLVFLGVQDGEFVVWTVADIECPYEMGFDRALISTKSYRSAYAQMILVASALSGMNQTEDADSVPLETAPSEPQKPLVEEFFEIAFLSRNGLRALLGEIDNAVLLCALAGAPAFFRHRVRSALNQRARDCFDRDFASLGDIIAAQEKMVKILCEMAARDEITLLDFRYIIED